MRELTCMGMIFALCVLSGCGSGTVAIATAIGQSASAGDRNAPPVAVIGDAAFVVNPDGRRGIPIAFEVRDREGEVTDVVFQWRRPNQSFDDPELRLPANASREQIAPLLEDPVLRRRRQIAAEMPLIFEGRIVRVDPTTDPRRVQVRLPELAGQAAGLLARGIVGRELEILVNPGSFNVEQRRSIRAYDPRGQLVTVDVPFNPPLTDSKPWRIFKRVNPIPALPQGVSDIFVWNSDEASIPRDVFVRAIPINHEIGVPGETTVAKRLGPRFELTAVEFPDPNTAPLPVFATVADLDGDGNLDLVSANNANRDNDPNQQPSVTIFFQRRSGEFTPDPLGAVDRGFPLADPLSVAVGDIDGDGKPDLVSANARTNPNVSIFHQTDPPGTFEITPTVLFASDPSDRPTSVAVADFDGDGRLDLISANDLGNSLTVFLQSQTTPGQFDRFELRPRFRNEQPQSVAVGDLDGDGRFDLISANGSGNSLSIFLQIADGVFPLTPTLTLTLPSNSFPNSVAIGDLNGDGNPDIACANRNANNVTVFFQSLTAPGNFVEPGLVLGARPLTRGAQSVALGDLDLDGSLDIAVANRNGNNLAVFFQVRRGEFEFDPRGPLGDASSTTSPRSVAVADLDGDGRLDIVSANNERHDLAVFNNPKRGAFALDPRGALGSATTTSGPVGVALGDFDQDGDLDLVSVNRTGNSLTLFGQTSPGQFNLAPGGILTDAQSMSMPAAVAAGDLNGDGRLDVVVANHDTNSVGIFYQTAPGQFAFDRALPVSDDPNAVPGPVALALADLTGDGFLDIVSANEFGDNVTVFFQRSLGGFETGGLRVSLSDPNSMFTPKGVAVADLNGDGFPDIVSANSGSDNLTIFFQTSAGVFSPTAQVVNGHRMTNGSTAVAVADVNGDGRLDLASANSGSQNLTVFLQALPPGAFGLSPPISMMVSEDPDSFAQPVSVAIADLNGDGNLDLVSANGPGDSLTVFLQGRNGGFASIATQTLGGTATTEVPQFVAIGDLDGDGELDLISANNNSNSLTIFYSGH